MTESAAIFEAGTYGVVECRNWLSVPWDGNQVKGVAGRLTLLHDTDLGLEVNSKDSNWLIKVEGDFHTSIIPGCQVTAVHTADRNDITNTNFAKVP